MGLVTKISLFAVNFIVFCLGVSIVVMSSIFINVGVSYGFTLHDDTFVLPVFALIIGIIILSIGFLGCYGALRENRFMLQIYSGILIVLLLAELIIGILILVNAHIPEEEIQKEMDRTFEKYGNDSSQIQINLDELQHDFKCCGVRNYTDWANYPYGMEYNTSLPDGCCKDPHYKVGCGWRVLEKSNFEDLIFTDGCYYIMELTIGVLDVGLGLVCLLFALIQAFSLCCACGLIRRSSYQTL